VFDHQTVFDSVWSPNISRLSRALWIIRPTKTHSFQYSRAQGKLGGRKDGSNALSLTIKQKVFLLKKLTSQSLARLCLSVKKVYDIAEKVYNA